MNQPSRKPAKYVFSEASGRAAPRNDRFLLALLVFTDVDASVGLGQAGLESFKLKHKSPRRGGHPRHGSAGRPLQQCIPARVSIYQGDDGRPQAENGRWAAAQWQVSKLLHIKSIPRDDDYVGAV